MKSLYMELLDLAEGSNSGVLVTVIAKEGSGPASTGTKMIVYADGKISGTVGGGSIEKMAIEKALDIFKTHQNSTEKYNMDNAGNGKETGMICGGTATLFFEYFAPKKYVYIFGAGHIGRALTYHLRQLNYHICLIDDREDVLKQVPDADEKIHAPFVDALNNKSVEKNAFFIIATYQHLYDGVVLHKIYGSDWHPKYIGMVSSQAKQKRMTEELLKQYPDANIDVLYTPAGLNVGGTLPHEIAISIISEMQTVANGKELKHLRD
ncbi:MAG: XdhC family protein [Candidatus Marinimicrobia bacterium]|nr:XdhC family protein [Candidatus Neomarinimicrobiota bacterium]